MIVRVGSEIVYRDGGDLQMAVVIEVLENKYRISNFNFVSEKKLVSVVESPQDAEVEDEGYFTHELFNDGFWEDREEILEGDLVEILYQLEDALLIFQGYVLRRTLSGEIDDETGVEGIYYICSELGVSKCEKYWIVPPSRIRKKK